MLSWGQRASYLRRAPGVLCRCNERDVVFKLPSYITRVIQVRPPGREAGLQIHSGSQSQPSTPEQNKSRFSFPVGLREKRETRTSRFRRHIYRLNPAHSRAMWPRATRVSGCTKTKRSSFTCRVREIPVCRMVSEALCKQNESHVNHCRTATKNDPVHHEAHRAHLALAGFPKPRLADSCSRKVYAE